MTTWHANPSVLAQFASAPEQLDGVTASSIEQHLIRCAECRAVVAGATAPTSLHDSWDAVADIIDRPRTTIVERFLARIGVPAELSRVVGATPGLRLAWLGTIVLLAGGAASISRSNDGEGLFLVLAPLLPLGSVLLTFLPADEPAGEAAAATPLYGAGVLIRRALASLVPTFAVLLAASVALPDLTDGARWLLPGLALAVGSLALSTYVRPVVAIPALGATWLALLFLAHLVDGRDVAMAQSDVFTLPGQVVALALALLAGALVHRRREHFSTVEVSW
jgi:MYXO-CTERM domain-containing protein